MSGFIGYIRTATDDTPEPPTPFVIHVQEPPGSTNEYLHTDDGRVWERGDLTVFSSEEEATEDAWQRLADDFDLPLHLSAQMSVKCTEPFL